MLLMVYKINILNLHILLVIKGLLSKTVTSKIYIFSGFQIKDPDLLPIEISNDTINNKNV